MGLRRITLKVTIETEPPTLESMDKKKLAEDFAVEVREELTKKYGRWNVFVHVVDDFTEYSDEMF